VCPFFSVFKYDYVFSLFIDCGFKYPAPFNQYNTGYFPGKGINKRSQVTGDQQSVIGD
jgi:hypothetical protein